MKPALAGLALIAICCFALGWLIPESQVPRIMWAFVYLVLAASAMFCWRHPKAPQSPIAWLEQVASAVIAGTLIAGLDFILYGVRERTMSIAELLDANPGIVLEMSIFLAAAVVALSGWLRCLVLVAVGKDA